VENVPEEHVRMGVAGAREDGGRGCTCGWGSSEHVRLGVAGARSPASQVGGGNWSGAPLSSMGSTEGVRH